MKIYSKPLNSHSPFKLSDHPHISKYKDYYVIRCVHQRTCYYFGSYTSLEEAILVNNKLSKQEYPIELSQKKLGGRGKQYTDKLKKKLNWIEYEIKKEDIAQDTV